MASQTQGIQQLLAAEKRAAEKVQEARKRKLSITSGQSTTFTKLNIWPSATINSLILIETVIDVVLFV